MGINRIGSVALGLALAASPVMVGNASAAKPKVPGAPTVVRIVSTASGTKYMDVNVMVELGAANGSNITKTVVSISGKSCTMSKSATSCTVKHLKNTTPAFVAAVSYNKVGRSRTGSGPRVGRPITRWVRDGYMWTGKKFPATAVSTANARVIQSGGSIVKWSKFQALRRGVGAASLRTPRRFMVDTPAITFQTSDAVALALPASGATGSGLLAVKRDGTTLDALGSGTATIRDFYAAPNNRFYVLFMAARAVTVGGPNCLLAEVDATSGNPVCVDSAAVGVTMSMGYYGANNGNPPIQFDDAGNIYYAASLPTQGGPPLLTLRKYVNGTVSNLINENITLRDFLVLGDGSVIISGTTVSTQTSWLRLITASGALRGLSSNAYINFIRKFADGNVYFGISPSGSVQGGVRRFLVGTAALDTKNWIGQSNGDPQLSSASFDSSPMCQWNSGYQKYPGFCSTSGGTVSATFNVGTSETYVLAGQRGIVGTMLMRYYPSVDVVKTTITNVTLAQQVGNKIILAGTNAESVNTLSVIDLTTLQETVIIDSSNEVEIYNLSYISATNRIMFNGLRFSDGKFVIGEVDLP